MAWQIDYTSTALKQLSKLDKLAAKRIIDFMDERISVLKDPRDTGKALTGAVLGAYWRYRIGDFRVICDIQDKTLCVLVVEVGGRKDVYTKHYYGLFGKRARVCQHPASPRAARRRLVRVSML